MGKKIAILIGVSQYDHETKLPPCENDLKIVTDIIKNTNKYDDYIVIGNSPTGDNAKNKIASFINKHQNQKISEVFFYYTGHGARFSGDFNFVFSDFERAKTEETSLRNSELDSMLKSLSPELTIKVVDACQAGTEYIKSGENLEDILKKSASSNFKNTYFFFSCTSSEESIAIKDKYSLFTKSFADAIVYYSGKTILYRDLMAFISDDKAVTSRQTPVFIQQAHNTETFCDVSDDLIKVINGAYEQSACEVTLNINTPSSIQSSQLISSKIHCSRCGKSPGSSSSCIGGSKHNFLAFKGTVYCSQCGTSPGSYSSCVGGSDHKFLSYKNNVYCSRCGKSPGSNSSCIGGSYHKFLTFKNNVLCNQCGTSPGSYSSCIGGSDHNFLTFE